MPSISLSSSDFSPDHETATERPYQPLQVSECKSPSHPEHFIMVASDDFSTNQSHVVPTEGSSSSGHLSDTTAESQEVELKPGVPVYHRHHLSFDDGNLALLVEDRYFIIHQGLLCRHSQVLHDLIVNSKDARQLLNRPVLELRENWTDMGCFLASIYDGVYVDLIHWFSRPTMFV